MNKEKILKMKELAKIKKMENSNNTLSNNVGQNLITYSSLINYGYRNNDKITRICSFLIGKINPASDDYQFSVKGLRKKFNCGRSTIVRALRVLKKAPTLDVLPTRIAYKRNVVGGDNDGNK